MSTQDLWLQTGHFPSDQTNDRTGVVLVVSKGGTRLPENIFCPLAAIFRTKLSVKVSKFNYWLICDKISGFRKTGKQIKAF